jgi:hypothetical protein
LPSLQLLTVIYSIASNGYAVNLFFKKSSGGSAKHG